MLVQSQSTKITIFTFISFILGLLGSQIAYNNSILITIPVLVVQLGIIFSLPKLFVFTKIIQGNIHEQKQIFKYTLTTYAFGIIDFLGFKFKTLGAIYLMILTIYHYGQFQLINLYHNKSLNWNSFLIYHSKHYTIANALSFLQHIICTHVFQFQYKNYHILVIPGALLMITGLFARLLAFYTAKSNFTHLIQVHKRSNHTLVTNGIYSLLRHPSYFGFFYFAVGSMIFIGNFFCSVAYIVTLHKFFRERIRFEEFKLIQFFGQQYIEYKKRTRILIPFIDNEKQQ